MAIDAPVAEVGARNGLSNVTIFYSFDARTGVQRLDHLVALCPPCHEVNHIGLASVRGRFDSAISHMMKVTGRSKISCRREAFNSIKLANSRARRRWKVDLSCLALPAPTL